MSTAQSFSGSRSIDYSLHQGPLHGLRGCPQPLRAATAKHGRAGASGGGGQVHQAGVHHKAYGGQPNLDNISWQLKVLFAYMFVIFLWMSTVHFNILNMCIWLYSIAFVLVLAKLDRLPSFLLLPLLSSSSGRSCLIFHHSFGSRVGWGWYDVRPWRGSRMTERKRMPKASEEVRAMSFFFGSSSITRFRIYIRVDCTAPGHNFFRGWNEKKMPKRRAKKARRNNAPV